MGRITLADPRYAGRMEPTPGEKMSIAVRAMTVMAPYLRSADRGVERSMERLSTGLRIVRASDDAAGLAISERLRARAAGALSAHRAATDAVSLVRTADGALSTVHDMLQRTRELAVQYANGSVSTADREALQAEASQLAEEVAALTQRTSFNGRLLLTGETFTAVVGDLDGDLLTITLPDAATAVPSGIFVLDGSPTGTTTTTNDDHHDRGAAPRGMAAEMTRYVGERLRRDAALAMAAQARTSASRVHALL